MVRFRPKAPSKAELHLGPGEHGQVWSDPSLAPGSKPIGLVRDQGKTILANPGLTDRLELTHGGKLSAEAKDALDGMFAFKESAEGAPAEAQGIATRYSDKRRGKHGGVRGDGRAVLRGELLLRADEASVPQLLEVGVKGGVVTGLQPIGAQGADHNGGAAPLDFVVKDAIVAAMLEANGLRAERFLAAQVLGPYLGRTVRAGDFERLAHLNELRDRPQELRAFLDRIGHKLALELGRPTRLSLDGVYRLLMTRKASDLADLFWMGIAHGATTYDNIGLLQHLDVSNMASYDRLHTTNLHELAPGLLVEPGRVMDLFSSELFRFTYEASSPAERKVLSKIDYETFATQELKRQMAGRLLDHLGLDEDDATAQMKHHRGAVMTALDTLFQLGSIPEPGGKVALPGTLGVPIQDPARYALFAALPVLAEQAGQPPGTEDLGAIAKALSPLSHDDARDLAVAKEMLEAVRPLIDAALAGVTGEARTAKRALITEQAQRINAAITELSWNPLMARTQEILQAVQADQPDRANALLQQTVRRNTRRGPGTPMEVAMALRHRALSADAEGWLSLNKFAENGVTIEEGSRGDQDRVRVTLEGNPMALSDAGEARLQISFGGGVWQTIAPTPGGTPSSQSFEVLVPPGALTDTLLVRFTSAAQDRSFDNAGLLFGAGYAPVLGSKLVSAELAHFGALRGRPREGAEVLKKAVAGAPRDKDPTRALPRSLRNLEDAASIRNAQLPDPRKARRSG
ncbi:MAG: hypothetical protein U1E65_09995 [Myxococcota bacterium]